MFAPLLIRPASPADRPQLRVAIVEMQDHERRLHATRLPGDQIADAYLDWMIERAKADGAVFVAESDGAFCGFVAGWVENEDNIAETPESRCFGYICDICVMPPFRGQRVAGRLLSEMESYLRRSGVTRLRINVLATNASARASYERAGFGAYEIMYEKAVSG